MADFLFGTWGADSFSPFASRTFVSFLNIAAEGLEVGVVALVSTASSSREVKGELPNASARSELKSTTNLSKTALRLAYLLSETELLDDGAGLGGLGVAAGVALDGGTEVGAAAGVGGSVFDREN